MLLLCCCCLFAGIFTPPGDGGRHLRGRDWAWAGRIGRGFTREWELASCTACLGWDCWRGSRRVGAVAYMLGAPACMGEEANISQGKESMS